MRNQGMCIYFTGLPCSGKSTLATALADRLVAKYQRCVSVLDGDVVRPLLSSELGFSKEHRSIHVRRVGYVASEIVKHGGIAICALIAPFQQDRQACRALISEYGRYLEIYVATPLAVCEKRDTKGLYAKARAGLISDFTGVNAPYEAPSDADLVLDTSAVEIRDGIEAILGKINPLFGRLGAE